MYWSRCFQELVHLNLTPKCEDLPPFFRKEAEGEEATWLLEATQRGTELTRGSKFPKSSARLTPSASWKPPQGLLLGKVPQALLYFQSVWWPKKHYKKKKKKKSLPEKKLVILGPSETYYGPCRNLHLVPHLHWDKKRPQLWVREDSSSASAIGSII